MCFPSRPTLVHTLEHIFQSQKTQIGCQRAFETDVYISLCVESPLLDIHTRRKSGSINSYCRVLEQINNQLAEDILEALTDGSACFQLLLSNRGRSFPKTVKQCEYHAIPLNASTTRLTCQLRVFSPAQGADHTESDSF
jgi:hypothetical protein